MYIKTVLVLLLFGIGSAIAEPLPVPVAKEDPAVPKQTIVGLEKVVKGDPIVLSLTPISDKNVTSYSEEWKVYDIVVKDDIKLVEKQITKFTTEDGGKAVFFGSGIEDKSMFVQVAVTYLYVTKEADKISKVVTKTVILTGEIKVGDGVKPPNPNPNPDIPDGRFGLTKFVNSSVNENVKTGKAVVSHAVAEVYDGVVTRIRSKTLSDPEKILEEVGNLVSKKLATLSGYDKPGWSKASSAVQDKLYDLYTAGSLKNADDYGDALQSLSAGLKLVK